MAQNVRTHHKRGFLSRRAVDRAPDAPSHALNYMHALEIMQQYSQVLSVASDLLRCTR
jgi:hypothetical protein